MARVHGRASPGAGAALRRASTATAVAPWLSRAARGTRRFVVAHPVGTVFGVAFAARTVAAVAIFVTSGGVVFLDDATYLDVAAALARGDPNPASADFTRAVAVFVGLLAAVFAVTGPVALVGQLVVAVFGALTAAGTAALACRVVPPAFAVFAGLAVALFPSQVLWSSLILKDPVVWSAFVALALLIAVGGRAAWRTLLGVAVAAAGILVALVFTRIYSAIIAAWGLALSSWVGRRPYRWTRLAGGVALAISIPFAFGYGPAGLGVVTATADSLAEVRARGAEGAETAIVPPEPPADADARDDLAHLPRGVSVVLLEPYPWQPTPTGGQLAAKVETALLWYPLLALAVFGLPSIVRRRRVVLFPLLVGGALVLFWALAEGNFGTAYRHRGDVVWIAALFAAAGAHRIAETLRTRGSVQ